MLATLNHLCRSILDLQRTQHDGKAERSGGLVLHARCDEVMRALAARLRLQVPPDEGGGRLVGIAWSVRKASLCPQLRPTPCCLPFLACTPLQVPAFVRRDAVVVGHQQHAPSRSTSGGGSSAAKGGKSASVGSGLAALELAGGSSSVKGSSEAAAADEADGDSGNSGPIHFSAFVQSSHGPKCRLPMVVRVDFAFEVRQGRVREPRTFLPCTACGAACILRLLARSCTGTPAARQHRFIHVRCSLRVRCSLHVRCSLLPSVRSICSPETRLHACSLLVRRTLRSSLPPSPRHHSASAAQHGAPARCVCALRCTCTRQQTKIAAPCSCHTRQTCR